MAQVLAEHLEMIEPPGKPEEVEPLSLFPPDCDSIRHGPRFQELVGEGADSGAQEKVV